MALRRNEMDRIGTREGQGRGRPQDDAPRRAPAQPGRPGREAEEREAVFDIADFAAIAHFAGIAPARRAG